MCEMDTDSAYIAIAGNSAESKSNQSYAKNFSKRNVTGFPVPTRMRTRLIISEGKGNDKGKPGMRLNF